MDTVKIAHDLAEALADVLGPKDANDRFERLAERFHRETCMFAPGKSVPIVLNDTTTDGKRWIRWIEWNTARLDGHRATLARYYAACGLIPCSGQASGDCDAMIPAGSGPSYTGFCEACDERRVDDAALT